MKWSDLTYEQGVTLRQWFKDEIEVKTSDNTIYKFTKYLEVKSKGELGSWVYNVRFDQMSTEWLTDFKKIWDALNKNN